MGFVAKGFVALVLWSACAMASEASCHTICGSDLIIDNFSDWSNPNHTNGHGSYASGKILPLSQIQAQLTHWCSDDWTMAKISAAQNTLSFTPKARSYFYETFPCRQANIQGFSALSFTVQGPAGGSIILEMQTRPYCSASSYGIPYHSYSSHYHTVTDLSGSVQTIVVPLGAFSGANTDAITGFVWSHFSKQDINWSLSNIKLVCGGEAGSSTSASSPATRTATATTAPYPGTADHLAKSKKSTLTNVHRPDLGQMIADNSGDYLKRL
jgi:hypothetical protein